MNRKEYYEKKYVWFEMFKGMRLKEIVFFGDKRVRCIQAWSVDKMMEQMNKFSFIDTSNNAYYSLAHIDWDLFFHKEGFQFFSYDPVKRKEQTELFNEVVKKYVTGYDVVFDFDNHDGKSYDLCRKECSELIELFRKFDVPHIIRFSGSGYHVIIPYKKLPKEYQELSIDELLQKIKELAIHIKFISGFETLDIGDDTGSFYDLRRVLKIPYSVDVKTNNVCLPVSYEEFIRNGYESFTIDKVMKIHSLFNRGDRLYRGDPQNLLTVITMVLS